MPSRFLLGTSAKAEARYKTPPGFGRMAGTGRRSRLKSGRETVEVRILLCPPRFALLVQWQNDRPVPGRPAFDSLVGLHAKAGDTKA